MKESDFLTTATAISETSAISNYKASTTANSETTFDKPLIPFHLPFTEPLQPGPGGIDIRILVRSSQTNMQYSSTETAVIPKLMGPPPHSHQALDEIILVTEGTATLWVDEKLIDVKPGEWYFMPRKSVHTFWNSSDQTLRFIGMYFQQNFEDYLEELFHQIIPDMVSNNLSPMDAGIAQRMQQLDDQFGVTMYPEKRQPLIEKYGLKD